MARKKQLEFSGRIRNIILYSWRDKTCMRMMPATVKQSVATKNAAADFGKACSISKVLRKALAPLLMDYKEESMRYRFNTVLMKWLRVYDPVITASGLPFIRQFSFSKPGYLNSVRKYASANSQQPGKLIIAIPGLNLPADLPAPKNTKSVLFQIGIAGCRIDNRENIPYQSRQIEITYEPSSVPGRTIEFDITREPGSLYIAVLSIRYKIFQEDELVISEDENWRAVGVVGSWFSGR
jgi:hypothetical protein